MAVRFDAATDRIAYTGGGVPDPASGFTLCGWAYVSVDRNDFQTLARLYDGGTTATLATSVDGLGGPNYFTGGGSVSAATGFVVGEWRKVGFTATGTTGTVYVATPDGATEVDSGTVSGAAAPTSIALGGRSVAEAIEWWNGRLAYVRVWSAVLSQAEIETEWLSPTPVRTTSLWADWPLETHTDLTDHSGNGRHMVAGSTSTTTEDGPPIAADVTGEASGDGGGVGAASGSVEVPGVAAGVGGGSGSAAGVLEYIGVAAGTGGAVGSATGVRERVGVAVGAGGGVGRIVVASAVSRGGSRALNRTAPEANLLERTAASARGVT